jgi:hypothetical protein
LDELLRITKPSGIIVLTVKDAVWNDGFKVRLDEFARNGMLSMLEETEPYVSMPGETGTTPSRAVVFVKSRG